MPIGRDKAKLILSCSHSEQGAATNSGPEIAEAFELLDTDAALMQWYQAEMAADEAIAGKIQEADCPDGLRQQLHDYVERAERKRIRSRTVLRIAFPLSAAALVAIVLFAFRLFNPAPFEFVKVQSEQTFEAFRSDMGDFARSWFLLDYDDGGFVNFNDWLKGKQWPGYEELPRKILSEDGVGCKVLNWGPKKTSLICFTTEADEIIHIFMIPVSDLEGVPAPAELAEPRLSHELETCGWIDHGTLFLLCASEPGLKVSPFLPSPDPEVVVVPARPGALLLSFSH